MTKREVKMQAIEQLVKIFKADYMASYAEGKLMEVSVDNNLENADELVSMVKDMVELIEVTAEGHTDKVLTWKDTPIVDTLGKIKNNSSLIVGNKWYDEKRLEIRKRIDDNIDFYKEKYGAGVSEEGKRMAKKTFDMDALESATNGFLGGTAYYTTKKGNVCYCVEAQWHSSKKNTFQCAAITENQQAQIEGAWNPGDSREVRRIIREMNLEFEPCKVKY